MEYPPVDFVCYSTPSILLQDDPAIAIKMVDLGRSINLADTIEWIRTHVYGLPPQTLPEETKKKKKKPKRKRKVSEGEDEPEYIIATNQSKALHIETKAANMQPSCEQQSSDEFKACSPIKSEKV